MDEKEKLIEEVIEQIKKDINDNDLDSLYEVLRFLSRRQHSLTYLISYLPEEKWETFAKLIK